MINIRITCLTLLFIFFTTSSLATRAQTSSMDEAIFAGGCFWCVESDFDHVKGVTSTTSGYIGGHSKNPTYKQVTGGDTGHIEAVKIEFDPKQVSFEQLINVFWRSVDPLDAGGQFCDRGESYTTAVFAKDDAQFEVAERTKKEVANQLGSEVATRILEATEFYPAEDYHQDYHNKNPLRYKYYRFRCRRDARIEKIWGVEAHQGIQRK